VAHDEGPRAASFNADPKALRKQTRRAAALLGADGGVLIVVSDGEVHLGCTHAPDWLGEVLEKALNDWRAAYTEAQRGQAPTAPVVVEARHLPKMAALRALGALPTEKTK
jgi:hypothetical protein